MPITGPKRPNAFGSSAVEKEARMMPKPCGIISAAERPCSRRKAISTPVLGAIPHSSDEAVKPTMPRMKRRRRP